MRAGCRDARVQGVAGLVPVGVAERAYGKVSLSRDMPMSRHKHTRGAYEPRSANLRQRPGHSGVRNDVRARKQKGTTVTIFAQYFRTRRERGETTLPLGQSAAADGDAVSLGIISRRDVPSRICHRRIYALIYNAIIFIILPAIRIPCSNFLHSPIVSLLLLSRFLNSRTGTKCGVRMIYIDSN